ncbi:MAG: hypothetical protein ACLPX5_05105 [Dissulfurispiraceae bacterium]
MMNFKEIVGDLVSCFVRTVKCAKVSCGICAEPVQKLCSCKPTKLVKSIPVVEIGFIECATLKDREGCTQFTLSRCCLCGGWSGFTRRNFMLALEKGTPETKEELKQWGIEVEAVLASVSLLNDSYQSERVSPIIN